VTCIFPIEKKLQSVIFPSSAHATLFPMSYRRMRRKRRKRVAAESPSEPNRKRMKIVSVPPPMKGSADESSLLTTAVLRGYPFAKETAEAQRVLMTVDFLFRSFDLLFPPVLPASAESRCLICDDTDLSRRTRGQAAPDCSIVSLTSLLQKLPSTPSSTLPSYVRSKAEFREFCSRTNLSWDVFVCLKHRSTVHLCSERCTKHVQTVDAMLCPISMRRRAVMQADEFENVDVKGVKTSVRVVSIPLERRRKRRIRRKVSFRFDGRRVSLGHERMQRNLSRLDTCVPSLAELRGVVSAQCKAYTRLVRRGVTSLEKVVHKVHDAKRNRATAAEVPKRRKPTKRRRSRRQVAGQFDRSSTEKISVAASSQTNRKFHVKKREFVKIYRLVVHYSAVRVVHYTQVQRALRSSARSARDPNFDRPGTAESLFVDPAPCKWLIPMREESLCTLTKNPSMFYLQFLLNSDIRSVIMRDMNREFSLHSEIQPRLLDAPKEFLDGLPDKIHFIRRLTPGLFRIIMLLDEIKKDAVDKYNSLKDALTNRHKRERSVAEEDLWDLTRQYDYKRDYLHVTCSDNFLLELAEVLYWAETTCKKHPAFETASTDISYEMIYVGTLYHMQLGLRVRDVDLIPKDVVLQRRNVLVPQCRLGLFRINRQDVTKGMEYVKNILLNLCKILPIEEVAFPLWKEKHGVLVPLEEFGEESLIVEGNK